MALIITRNLLKVTFIVKATSLYFHLLLTWCYRKAIIFSLFFVVQNHSAKMIQQHDCTGLSVLGEYKTSS